jgi:hypothetical protein
MAARPKKKTTTIEEEIESIPEHRVEVLEPGEVELEEYIRSLGDGQIRVRIHEQTAGRWVFRGDVAKEEADEAKLQTLIPAGGVFKLDVFFNGELRHSRVVNIGPALGQAPMIAGQSGGFSQEIGLMFKALTDRLDLLARPQATSNVTELAQAVAAVRETASAPVDPMASMAGMFGLMTKMMEFVKNGGSAEPVERPWWQEILAHPAVAPVLVPAVQGLLGGFMQQQNGNAQPPVAPPRQVEENPMQAQLRGILQYLKTQLAVGPDAFLDMVEGHPNDPSVQSLLRVVSTESFEFFTSLDPEIGQPPYVQFFRPLYDGLRSYVQGQNPMATDTGGGNGNTSNLGRDGKLGKKGKS